MVTRCRPIVAATLGALLCWPTVATARVPGASVSALALHAPALERRGRLEVDATALGESRDVVVGRIEEMTKVVFEREAVRFADGPDDPVMKILIVPLEGDTAGYRITWQVERSAKEVPGSKGFSDCRLCTEGELVDAVVAGIELSVEKMEVRVEPEPEPVAETTPVEAAPDPTTAPSEDKGTRKLGPMGIAGIALTAVGAAGLGTGIGLAVRKPTPSDSDPTRLVDTRKHGYGALAGGAAVAVAGVVLLVLDLRRSRSTARADTAPRTAMAPWVVPGSGGLSLSGRF